MPFPHSIFTYIFCGVVGALLAIEVSGTPLSLVGAYHYSPHFPRITSKTVLSDESVKTDVNRSLKGDRLPLTRTMPILNTGVIQKNVTVPEDAVHIVPIQPRALEINEGKRAPMLPLKLFLGCEPVASPFTDPILGHMSGRCLV